MHPFARAWDHHRWQEEMKERASAVTTLVYDGDHLFACRRPTALTMAALVTPLIEFEDSGSVFTPVA